MRLAAMLMGFLIFWESTILGGSAQDKAKHARPEQPPPAAVTSSDALRMGGIIIAIDPSKHKLLIQQYNVKEERIVALYLGEEENVKISEFRKGDAVNIWVKGNRIMKIEKISDPDWKGNEKERK